MPPNSPHPGATARPLKARPDEDLFVFSLQSSMVCRAGHWEVITMEDAQSLGNQAGVGGCIQEGLFGTQVGPLAQQAERGSGGCPSQQNLPLRLTWEQKQSPAAPPPQGPPAQETRAPSRRLHRLRLDQIPSQRPCISSIQELLLPIQNQVRENCLSFPAGVSVPPGEGLRKSLQTEHERQVGTKPHSLGGPAAAKITDKLTYKESFYFMSKPQRLTAEPPAGDPHGGAEASPAAPAWSPGTSASRRNVSQKRQGEREERRGGFQKPWLEGVPDMRTPAHSHDSVPELWVTATVKAGSSDFWQGHHGDTM